MYSKKIKINPKIKEALENNKPIVALESTLISHGLPYPENMNVANESIKAVESSGCVAATIAVINGEIKIGLEVEDIKILATANDVEKVSLNNIAPTFDSVRLSADNASVAVTASETLYTTTGGSGALVAADFPATTIATARAPVAVFPLACERLRQQ